jgi:PTS system nitrogen regulatory IIA component
MRIADFLKVECVVPALLAKNKAEVLAELAQNLALTVSAVPYVRFHTVLEEREKIGSTGMEKGIAIPHGRLSELPTLVASFGVSREGVAFDARDGQPSRLFFALVAPENSAGLHLKALSRISRLFRSEALKDAILQAQTAEEIYALINAEDGRG